MAKQKVKIDLRTPKGTIDYSPEDMILLGDIINAVKGIFRKHGGVEISTPSFELRNILMDKYGDDAKLVYNLEDQGGDICSLRYDLTVPFARYLSQNKIRKIKRYQIDRVYRRDNPSFKTGRLREFYQGDFDICGQNGPMVNDVEILKIVSELLNKFKGDRKYKIRLNDRRILSGILHMSGIEKNMEGNICSSIDKLGKTTFAEISREMKEKGLNLDQICSIGSFLEKQIDMENKSNLEIIGYLSDIAEKYMGDGFGIRSNIQEPPEDKNNEKTQTICEFKKALDELKLLLEYCSIYKIENVKVDISLARGLSYYTGIIFEGFYLGTDIGSVIGGGRFDNLCSSISTHEVPSVGFSIGINRIFLFLKKNPLDEFRKKADGIFVGSGHGLLLKERMSLMQFLWDNNIRSETFTGTRVNFMDQVQLAGSLNYCGILFLGDEEIARGVYIYFCLESKEKIEIKKDDIEKFLQGEKFR